MHSHMESKYVTGLVFNGNDLLNRLVAANKHTLFQLSSREKRCLWEEMEYLGLLH